MSRRATGSLTMPFVLRTFKRVNLISARYSAETIAKALIDQGREIGGAPDYLNDIRDYMRDFQRKAGVDPDAHPNGNCLQCSQAIGCDHNGARYCSTRCRQRAWRERRAAAQGRNAPPMQRQRRFNPALAK